jgi:hypothetical protein
VDGQDYDLKGDYIRAWVPELKSVSSSRIHEPWLMSKEEQQQFGVQLGVDYPTPIPLKRSQDLSAGNVVQPFRFLCTLLLSIPLKRNPDLSAGNAVAAESFVLRFPIRRREKKLTSVPAA